MPSVTGIELGSDSCVLARATLRDRAIEVSAAHVIGPAEWPDRKDIAVEMLRTIRRSQRMPRIARVVIWHFDEYPEAAKRAATGLLEDAGFRIDAVLTPQQALAALARSRRTAYAPHVAIAWLALNRQGAAMVIVRGGAVLYSRAFRWSITAPAERAQANLLRRYLRVAQLAPELRHAMEAVRRAQGVTVGTVITCGDLPDLRSLTMPLIEETDLEVETLDSLEGLAVNGADASDVMLQWAPALRLACAAAFAPEKIQPKSDVAQSVMRVAAAGLLAAGLGWWVWAHWSSTSSAEAPPQSQTAGPTAAVERSRLAAPQPTSPPNAGEISASPKSAPQAAANSPRPAAAGDPTPQPTTGRVENGARPPVRRVQSAPDPPLPRVDSILVGSAHPLALVDGRLVQVGDTIGAHTVIAIEPRTVRLRAPSGREVSVGITPRSGRRQQ